MCIRDRVDCFVDEVFKGYSQSGRGYHGVRHLVDGLSELGWYLEETGERGNRGADRKGDLTQTERQASGLSPRLSDQARRAWLI